MVRAAVGLMLALSATGAFAQDTGDRPRFKVGVAGSAPFVLDTAPPTGLSVDVFHAVAVAGAMPYELVAVPTVDEAVARVARGELDVAVGPISVTAERLAQVSFTQPYFQAGLSLLGRPSGPSAWDRLRPFFTRAFFYGAFVLLLILTGVGALVWLAERKVNPQQFPAAALPGSGAGIWLALVTMTTVGYGDKAPATGRGRLVMGVWMLVSMLTASSLTAGIATALTLSQLDRPALATVSELEERRVATVAGSTSVGFAGRHGALVTEAPTLEAAIALLTDGEVDAVVFDRPMLRSYLRAHPTTPATLSESSYEARGYAFAVAHQSPLLNRLNVALLSLTEAGRLEPIRHSWLGE
jgi:polar amino acid transport system substrate-binding protein